MGLSAGGNGYHTFTEPGQTLRTPSFNLHNIAIRKVLLLTLFNSTKPVAPGSHG